VVSTLAWRPESRRRLGREGLADELRDPVPVVVRWFSSGQLVALDAALSQRTGPPLTVAARCWHHLQTHRLTTPAAVPAPRSPTSTDAWPILAHFCGIKKKCKLYIRDLEVVWPLCLLIDSISLTVYTPHHCDALSSRVFIIIIIIEKTDAGLNGLYIRDINVLYDFINIYNKY